MSNATKRISSRFSFLLALGALLTWVACIPTDVWANAGPGMERGPNYGHGKGMHDFVGKALHGLLRNQKELGLSKEQSSKIKTIATDYAKSRIQEQADVKLAELDVRTRIFDEKTELSSIEAALQKSASAHIALRLEGVKALRAATAILTPEQREKWHQSSMNKHEGETGWKGHKGNDKDHEKDKDY
jgi:Spy/CpxP family protein refolding chaperone